MDQIFIKNLTYWVHIGVTPEEQSVPQPIQIDLIFELDLHAAAQTDDIQQTLDYSTIPDFLDQQLQMRFKLLETLGEHLIQKLLSFNSLINSITLTLTKPRALLATNTIGICIKRTRDAYRQSKN